METYREIIISVVFITSCIGIEKLIDRFIFKIEDKVKGDINCLIRKYMPLQEFLSKWWLIFTIILALSALLTFVIATYYKLILALLLLVLVCIILFLDDQQSKFNDKKMEASQLIERLEMKTTNYSHSTVDVAIKSIDISRSNKEYIFEYRLKSSLFFYEKQSELFQISLKKNLQEESEQLKWLAKDKRTMLRYDIKVSDKDELTVIIAICSNLETKKKFESYSNNKQMNKRLIEIEDDDF